MGNRAVKSIEIPGAGGGHAPKRSPLVGSWALKNTEKLWLPLEAPGSAMADEMRSGRSPTGLPGSLNFMAVAEQFKSANFADFTIDPSTLYALSGPSVLERIVRG